MLTKMSNIIICQRIFLKGESIPVFCLSLKNYSIDTVVENPKVTIALMKAGMLGQNISHHLFVCLLLFILVTFQCSLFTNKILSLLLIICEIVSIYAKKL